MKSLWYTRIEQKIIGTCREALFTEVFVSTGELVEMKTTPDSESRVPAWGGQKEDNFRAVHPMLFSIHYKANFLEES